MLELFMVPYVLGTAVLTFAVAYSSKIALKAVFKMMLKSTLIKPMIAYFQKDRKKSETGAVDVIEEILNTPFVSINRNVFGPVFQTTEWNQYIEMQLKGTPVCIHVFGPNNVGKTSGVTRYFHDKIGVIYIPFRDANYPERICRVVSSAVGYHADATTKGINEWGDISDAIRKSVNSYFCNNKSRVVFILDDMHTPMDSNGAFFRDFLSFLALLIDLKKAGIADILLLCSDYSISNQLKKVSGYSSVSREKLFPSVSNRELYESLMDWSASNENILISDNAKFLVEKVGSHMAHISNVLSHVVNGTSIENALAPLIVESCDMLSRILLPRIEGDSFPKSNLPINMVVAVAHVLLEQLSESSNYGVRINIVVEKFISCNVDLLFACVEFLVQNNILSYTSYATVVLHHQLLKSAYTDLLRELEIKNRKIIAFKEMNSL